MEDQSRAHGLHQRRMNRPPRSARDHGQCGGLGDCCPGRRDISGSAAALGGKAAKPAGHEIHHVVSDSPWRGCDPCPSAKPAVTGSNASSPSSASAVMNWIAKNGLPPVFSWTSSRQWPRALRFAMQGIGDEPADIVELEGRQHDLMHPRIGLADRLERAQQRVRGADLVVPVGADQQQVPHLRSA